MIITHKFYGSEIYEVLVVWEKPQLIKGGSHVKTKYGVTRITNNIVDLQVLSVNA